MGLGAFASGPIFVVQRFIAFLWGICCYRCPKRLRGDNVDAMAARYNGHRVAFKGEATVSEQAIYGAGTNVGVQLLNRLDDGRLPVDVHDFAEAINRCVLVDKTMFIADVLDCDASVVVCCRPKGFGKSMNLSMLRAFLERPAVRSCGRSCWSEFVCRCSDLGCGRWALSG